MPRKVWCEDCEWRENPDIMKRVMADTIGMPFMSPMFLRYGQPPKYDQHRQAFIETGDMDELRRMTEHVELVA